MAYEHVRQTSGFDFPIFLYPVVADVVEGAQRSAFLWLDY